jgi:flagellar basal body-associated protein FliL
MADREENKQADQQVEEAPSKNRKRLMAAGAILLVMGLEALAIFILVKTYVAPSPQAAQAQEFPGLDSNAGEKAPRLSEVEVAKVRALNEKSPRAVIYDLTVYAVIAAEDRGAFEAAVNRRKQTIRDRFVTIVRGADPSYFREPDLLTLRTQLKTALAKIVGEEINVQEVLVPAIIPFREG